MNIPKMTNIGDKLQGLVRLAENQLVLIWRWWHLVAGCFVLVSTHVSATELDLSGTWQFHQHQSQLSQQELQETDQWQQVTVPALLSTRPPNGIYGTYRLQFDVPKSQLQQELSLFIGALRGPDRVYLNGVAIGGEGKISKPWYLLSVQPNNMPRLYHIAGGLLTEQNNELIVNVQLGYGEAWGAMAPGGAGIFGSVTIQDRVAATASYWKQLARLHWIEMVMLVLSIIDLALLLLLFRHTFSRLPELKWLMASSLLLFVGGLMFDVGYIYGISTSTSNAILWLATMLFPWSNALFFDSDHRYISRNIAVVVTVLIFLCGVVLLAPVSAAVKDLVWLTWGSGLVLMFGFATYCAVLNLMRGYTGSAVTLGGLLVLLASVRTQWLPFDGLGSLNIVVGSLIFRYALVVANFLKIQKLSIDYENLGRKLLKNIEENNKRIARDVHDDLGQHLSAAKLHLQLAQKNGKDKHFLLADSELQLATTSMRHIVNGLHPAVLEKYTLKQSLKVEVNRLQQLYEVSIGLTVQDGDIPKRVTVHVYHIVQELIFNAIKHGKATCIDIKISIYRSQLLLVVADNGSGWGTNFEQKLDSEGGFGSISITERVSAFMGNVTYSHKNAERSVQVMLRLTDDQVT